MTRRTLLRRTLCGTILAPLLLAAGCHSYHIDTTIQNRTGAAIRLLEVDYPDASFGTDIVTAGSDYHYRIQIQGSGPLKITYTGPGNTQVHIKGPELTQHQQGRLQIVLLPGGKADFQPDLTRP